jgi:hypothetical protein|tara:strand:+ start:336 stop:761 length:426 start_codon:yes stop_codon:yes gene_type:complete
MTGDLTERALASLLKDVGYTQEDTKEATAAQEARIRESKIANILAMGEKNYLLEAASRQKTQARTGSATANTATEDFADIQKIVKDRQQRRPGLMYQPPKFTRGAPTATPSAQQRMMQVVGRMLEELQKNIELPTEESTDA